MKRFPVLLLMMAIMIAGLVYSPIAFAQEVPPEAHASGAGTLLWTFANSPVGLMVISSVLVFVLGKVFMAKPEWQKVFDQYRGAFFDAVSHAEKAIPDDTPNTAARRADAALKFLLQLYPHLEKVPKAELNKAVAEAHAAKVEAGSL